MIDRGNFRTKLGLLTPMAVIPAGLLVFGSTVQACDYSGLENAIATDMSGLDLDKSVTCGISVIVNTRFTAS